jgi:hypothetical protein
MRIGKNAFIHLVKRMQGGAPSELQLFIKLPFAIKSTLSEFVLRVDTSAARVSDLQEQIYRMTGIPQFN